jgi:hypothetical protein
VILGGLLIGISRSEGSSQSQKLSEAVLSIPPGE